ncbi:hypothetical protein BXP28_01205 [Paenibacillus larvae subsp. larvae]|nr:hypothetical protein BXP28_01205 [Paenibacillus larvae subsp. larvae]
MAFIDHGVWEFDIEEHIKNKKSCEGLSDVEQIFLELCCFFEHPDRTSFDLSKLFQFLDGSWLTLALEAIHLFFKKDTYLLPEGSDHMYIVDKAEVELLNQTQFADMLREAGFRYDRRKINVYYKRGKLPPEDKKIGGKVYWFIDTVEQYIQDLLKATGTEKR